MAGISVSERTQSVQCKNISQVLVRMYAAVESLLDYKTTCAGGLEFKYAKTKRYLYVKRILDMFKFKDKLFFFLTFVIYTYIYICMSTCVICACTLCAQKYLKV